MVKKFWVLWGLGVAATVSALPYIFTLQRSVIEKAGQPLWLVGLASTVQAGILLAIVVFLGLKLAEKINLNPFVFFDSTVPVKENLKQIAKLCVPIGVLVALIIRFGDFFFLKSIPELKAVSESIPFWKALLVAPYGGVVEELLMRLFLVTLFAWLFGKFFKSAEVPKNNWIMWAAIVIVSIIFGLGHLPATATIVALTPIVIARAIILNGIGGIFFGWLYWKKGLEYAIVAHFTTDIVLHAVLPLF